MKVSVESTRSQAALLFFGFGVFFYEISKQRFLFLVALVDVLMSVLFFYGEARLLSRVGLSLNPPKPSHSYTPR